MIRLRNVLRLARIHRVLVRNELDEFISATHLLRPLRWLFWIGGSRAPASPSSRGARIRMTLEELGPIFVKFGQALSTRRDLLPDDIAVELVKLQDRVPPFSGTRARELVESALGKPILEIFREFDETPLASASIAQVHAATLFGGEAVIVKVLRPDVEPQIRADIALLYDLADLARRFWTEAKRLRPVEVVAEFEKTIIDELDLVREAANAAEIRRHFENSEMLYIPKVYWDYTRRNVMVMERVYGIPVGDIPAMRAAGADLKVLAERGVEIFFTQVFRDNFFHADMHPGNIFVSPSDNRYIAVDFGIVGSLSKADQRYVAENIHAFFNRDYRRVAEMHVESGWVPRSTRVEEFESAIRSVCEPIFEKPLKEISYGHLLLRLFQTARRYNMEVQPQLVLLQKTLLNIEGLGRELYPDLDLWTTAKPFLEKWFQQRVGPRATLDRLREQIPQFIREAPELPGLVHSALAQATQGQLEVRWRSDEIAELRAELRRNQRRSLLGVMAAGCLIGAAILFALTPAVAWALTFMTAGLALFGLAWV